MLLPQFTHCIFYTIQCIVVHVTKKWVNKNANCFPFAAANLVKNSELTRGSRQQKERHHCKRNGPDLLHFVESLHEEEYTTNSSFASLFSHIFQQYPNNYLEVILIFLVPSNVLELSRKSTCWEQFPLHLLGEEDSITCPRPQLGWGRGGSQLLHFFLVEWWSKLMNIIKWE